VTFFEWNIFLGRNDDKENDYIRDAVGHAAADGL
jgi:hypothetical protein